MAIDRTYRLTVPVHDLRGDAPTESGTSASISLMRLDGHSNAPLYGPEGLVVGRMSTDEFIPMDRPADTDLHPESVVFELLPTAYFRVQTQYVLSVAGRTYTFQMPERDESILELFDQTPIDPSMGGGATDETARNAANAAQRTADANAAAIAENRMAIAENRAGIAAGGLPALPEDGHEYTLRGRDNLGAGGTDDPIRYWDRPNYVPNAPGTQSAIGDVLMVTGEGDTDYRWLKLTKARLYAAVKEIFHPATNAGVTADDANNELDVAAATSGGTASPPASESTAGIVRGATSAQATASSGTTILGWTVNRLRALIQAALPTVSNADAIGGTSEARRAWTALRVRQAIRAVTDPILTRANDNTREVRLARSEAQAAQTAANAASTLTRKVALLTLYVDPGVVEQQGPATRVTAITGNYRLIMSPPDVLAGEDVWIRVFGQGVALHNARVKLNVAPAPQFVIPFAIDETAATNIHDNDTGDDTVDIEVRFYASDSDAGLFEARTVPLDIVQTPRVDDKQDTLPELGNGQVWVGNNRRAVPSSPPASPVIIVSNIASFDATQNRFEDSSGNEVMVPDGSIVTLTQAVYDAAVSDAEFTPNAAAIFLTR